MITVNCEPVCVSQLSDNIVAYHGTTMHVEKDGVPFNPIEKFVWFAFALQMVREGWSSPSRPSPDEFPMNMAIHLATEYFLIYSALGLIQRGKSETTNREIRKVNKNLNEFLAMMKEI
jgi:hypothetical protein